MCGRYTLAGKPVDLEKQLRASLKHGAALKPAYNIAPGGTVAAVLCNDSNTIVHVKWGLTPTWSAKSRKPLFLVNLRDDTIKTKPAFKRYLENRRCIIPASGFYEWKLAGTKKQAYYFRCLQQKFMFFAGIYEPSSDQNTAQNMVSILTTAANSLVNPIHNRMPVILRPEQARRWLEGDAQDQLAHLLQSYPAAEMECWPVSSRVNKVGIDDPTLIEPVADTPNLQTSLF